MVKWRAHAVAEAADSGRTQCQTLPAALKMPSVAAISVLIVACLGGAPVAGDGKSRRLEGSTMEEVKPEIAAVDLLPRGACSRLGTHRLTHLADAHSLAFSNDGKELTVVTRESSRGHNTARVWDTTTRQLLHDRRSNNPLTLLGPVAGHSPSGAAWVPVKVGGSVFAFWDVTNDLYISIPGLDNPRDRYGSLILSRDGKVFAISNRTSLEVRSFPDNHLVAKRPIDGPLMSLLISHDNTLLAGSSYYSPSIAVWRATDGKLIYSFEGGGQDQLSLSPDSRLLVASGENGSLQCWEVDSGKRLWKLGDERAKNQSVTFSPAGNLLAAGRQDDVVLADSRTGKLLRRFHSPGRFVSAVSFSPDGSVLASASGPVGRIRLWNVATGEELGRMPGHMGEVLSLSFSHDGTRLASGGADHIVVISDPRSGYEARRFESISAPLRFVGFSSDGSFILSQDSKGYVQTWAVENRPRQVTLKLCLPEHRLGISSSGRLLACRCSDSIIEVKDLTSGHEVISFPGTSSSQHAYLVDFSRDGRFVQAWSDHHITLWDLTQKGHPPTLRLPRDARPIAVAPEGSLVAYDEPGEPINITDMRSGQRVALLGTRNKPHIAAFSPDGRALAWADSERITVHEIASSQIVRQFRGHQQYINDLVFSPNGTLLASGGLDSVVYTWDVTGLAPKGKLDRIAYAEVELEKLWNELSDNEGHKAWLALWSLVASNERAVKLLTNKVQPAKMVDERLFGALLKKLDSSDFRNRTEASAQLSAYGRLGEQALRRFLADKPSLESRQRVEAIVKELPAQELQKARAVAVLEHIGSQAAKDLLTKLKNGAPEAALTKEAAAALNRLTKGLIEEGDAKKGREEKRREGDAKGQKL